jgi:hypothetical protein
VEQRVRRFEDPTSLTACDGLPTSAADVNNFRGNLGPNASPYSIHVPVHHHAFA